jgi:citrate lyase subunit beta/citryl-CoA lyase
LIVSASNKDFVSFTTPPAALFMRGDAPRHLARLESMASPALIIDLEDAVDPDSKPLAHKLVRETLSSRVQRHTPRVWVRINEPGQWREPDLEAAVWPGVEALMIPKIEGREDIDAVSALLDNLETERGIAPGTIGLIGQVETPRGIQRLDELDVQKSPRLRTLAFGPADYCQRLQIPIIPGSHALEYARAALVVGTRAAGLHAPLDGPWLSLGDDEGREADACRSRSHGYSGRLAIHPAQVESLVRTFQPDLDPAELEQAEIIVKAWKERPAGAGTAVAGDIFIDPPVYRRAADLLRSSQNA